MPEGQPFRARRMSQILWEKVLELWQIGGSAILGAIVLLLLMLIIFIVPVIPFIAFGYWAYKKLKSLGII